MRKVWGDNADVNPLESDNKLVAYHSWFASHPIDLQAGSRTLVRNGGGPLTTPRYLHLDLSDLDLQYLSYLRLVQC